MPDEPLLAFESVEDDPNTEIFWVRLEYVESLRASLPTANVTTYAAFLQSAGSGLALDEFASWLFAYKAPAQTPGWMRFYFARSTSGTELAGRSHSSPEPLPPEQFLLGSIIESRKQIVPYGTSPDTAADVLQSKVTPIDGVRSRINTNAVLSYDGTPLYSWALDEETGKGYMVTEEAVPAGTTGSSEVAADGLFADVRPVNAFWSIKTTKKTTTLTNTPVVWTNTERSPVYWPAVLISHEWLFAVNSSATYMNKLLAYTLKAAYTGDVQVTYSEWWQKSEPTPITPTEMLPTSINIPLIWSPDISIPECLHPAFSVSEPLLVRDTLTSDEAEREVTRSVPATNYLDWPDEVVKLNSERYMGGFRCLQRTVPKPQSTVSGVIISQAAWSPLGGTEFEGYP